MGSEHDGREANGAGRKPLFDSYARLSRVPDTGELEKIDTQFEDNRKKITDEGGELGLELSDGMSAWRKGVRRPGWERLLERVRSGESDGIAVWHTDRLFRQPRDLEKLIDLADRGLKVVSSHGARDLADSDDRYIMRIEVAHAARSSDDTQRRMKRRLKRRREKGIPQSHARSFGWPGLERPRRQRRKPAGAENGPEDWRAALIERESRPERLPVPARQVARERIAIRQGSKDVLAEVPLSEIAQQWNDAGVLTAEGNLHDYNTVRTILNRASNAGMIESEGVVVGHLPGHPIVPEETFTKVRALFVSRQVGAVNRGAYVGSGIARCELCDHTMTSRPHVGTYPDGLPRRQYACRKNRNGCGKVAADGRAVDREIRAFVIRRLSDTRHAAALTAARARVAGRLAEVEQEISDCEGLIEALSARLGRRAIRLAAYDAAVEPLEKDLAKLVAEREQLEDGPGGGPVDAMTRDEAAQQYDNADMPEKRSMLQLALGREKLHISPSASRGRKGFDPNRVKLPRSDRSELASAG